MADLPQNNTDRIRLVYRNITGTHRATLRCASTTQGVEATLNLFSLILNGLGDYLPSSFVILGMERIYAGSTVAVPIGTIDPTLNLNEADISGTQYAGQWRWEGRAHTTLNGVTVASKVNFSLMGLMCPVPPSFRYAGMEQPRFHGIFGLLNSKAGNNVYTAWAISGQKATWYDYTNFNYNSHFERKFRG